MLNPSPNTAMQICRNKGATKKASRKTVHDKVFKVLAKKGHFYQNICGTAKTKYNLYIGINVLVYGKCLIVNVWSMTKKSFCFNNPFLE